MTSRERFEAWWLDEPESKNVDVHSWYAMLAWQAWQAVEAATARRCAEIVRASAGRVDGAQGCERDMRAEYPEAFK